MLTERIREKLIYSFFVKEDDCRTELINELCIAHILLNKKTWLDVRHVMAYRGSQVPKLDLTDTNCHECQVPKLNLLVQIFLNSQVQN